MMMQKIFVVISQLILLFALEQGNIVRLLGEEKAIASTKSQTAWVLINKGTVEKICKKKKINNFFT